MRMENEELPDGQLVKGAQFGDMESGLARYDEETGEATVLASSRRRLGQNQFDDRDYYDI